MLCTQSSEPSIVAPSICDHPPQRALQAPGSALQTREAGSQVARADLWQTWWCHQPQEWNPEPRRGLPLLTAKPRPGATLAALCTPPLSSTQCQRTQAAAPGPRPVEIWAPCRRSSKRAARASRARRVPPCCRTAPAGTTSSAPSRCPPPPGAWEAMFTSQDDASIAPTGESALIRSPSLIVAWQRGPAVQQRRLEHRAVFPAASPAHKQVAHAAAGWLELRRDA